MKLTLTLGAATVTSKLFYRHAIVTMRDGVTIGRDSERSLHTLAIHLLPCRQQIAGRLSPVRIATQFTVESLK